MDVHVACKLFLILDLFSHGISVPIYSNYDETQSQGYQVSDDITDLYERYPRSTLPNPHFWQRYPRSTLPNPYFWQQNPQWFTRSHIPSRPKQASKRHYHLFHLTSKHPNAVSYHVIEKSHQKAAHNRHEVDGNPRRSSLYNNGQYPVQSYYQQPAYQYPGYPAGYGSSYPQTQYGVQNNGVHDSTYDDILDVVSKPMNLPIKTPTYASHSHSTRQNDEAPSIEEAAKQFKLASADMNNMELASLVMYPLPRFNVGEKPKVHKKKSKRKHKQHDKKIKEEKPKAQELKVENTAKEVTNLVDTLINNGKEEKSKSHTDAKEKQKMAEEEEKEKMEMNEEDQETKEDKKVKNEDKDTKNKKKKHDERKKVKDEDDDDGMDDEDKDSTPKDSWNEENVSTKEEDDEYTSTKRTEIPHVFDDVSNSDDTVDESNNLENSSVDSSEQSEVW